MMPFVGTFESPNSGRKRIEECYRADETETVKTLLGIADLGAGRRARIQARARNLVEGIRSRGTGAEGLDAFLQEYELSNREGVVLMCLAEALLRIPDAATADKLIKSKLSDADWGSHLGNSQSVFVNASTWALMLTGRVINLDDGDADDVGGYLGKLVARSGEPVIRQAMIQAMKILGRQFVMGRTIQEALERARDAEKGSYRHSYDMLGEAARTDADALRYFDAYAAAIDTIGEESRGLGPIDAPGISVKLSALHPRYELAQRDRVMTELLGRIRELAVMAKRADIGLTIDAEEADRLDISLDVLEALSGDPALKGWNGLGLAVQAYQKRAYAVLQWLAETAEQHDRKWMVRLVKGAYWDTEIKHAQELGMDGYPVFTRKPSTDLSYLACARFLIDHPDQFYPQFATHNAHTLAAVIEMAGDRRDFEFQRLHGMGETLYDQIVGHDDETMTCRIYAPVGSHEDLLAYLVRRLLENGANTSFVNRIVDKDAPIDDIIADPVAIVGALAEISHPMIPLPRHIFGPDRSNSCGIDLTDNAVLRSLAVDMAAHAGPWHAATVGGDASPISVIDPARPDERVGTVAHASKADIDAALAAATAAQPAWDALGGAARGEILSRAADAMEAATPMFMAMCTREAGKTLADGIAEVREAVDFLRYYAVRALAEFEAPEVLVGPTGEANSIRLHGRGVFACISPWNFPLAIFTGQVSAALAAGNGVIAKPAEQTPLIAAEAVKLLHQAGVPTAVLHLLPGDGPSVGGPLIADPRISGVAFTGSTETAKLINRQLADRPGPIVPLIAETGGQNAMIVDSSALAEQVVEDAVFSAFRSAGQRCSALRVMFVQNDIADKVIDMLCGATEELKLGDPGLLETDIGPVIDADAKAMLDAHADRMSSEGRLLCRAPLPDNSTGGFFVAPAAFEIDGIERLEREVFGPILHVIRYQQNKLDAVIDAINETGYGLTLGIHSRIDSVHHQICSQVRAGNAYVNRNMIGAVVGVQPFGGEGLSGTGPKAGGPRYLHRFAVERTLSVNTTAAGGNAALMSMEA
jgi:RHH-type transcriptional regulator, proline utilization regulon repressor / proline dehydrogenase / delta 1-pyrroline-5-carboxylate dehydrogenase